ncbi:MAG: glycosyltransferase family 2 protein [Anaerolineae bacterium]|nr:glycosyltransferase family 2 protein [Anaerolineae bacterium]
MAPKVYIIVLNWNNAPDTCACLESLLRLETVDSTVLVVDNGSTDNSLVEIAHHFPHVEILQTGENLGYAEGNNAGIRHALANGAEYVCILNNDTVVDPGCVRALLGEAESNPDVGIVGPKMYFSDPPDAIFCAGSTIDWKRGRLIQRGIRQRESEVGPLYAAGAEDVDFIVGCCLLVKREVIAQIGLLDARYYLNFEDVDWCLRARKAGWRVRYTPEAVLWHKVSSTLGQASPRNTYYMTRNRLLFFFTHGTGWQRWQSICCIVARNLGHIAAWTLKKENRVTARAKRNTNILALRDAALGRFGKMGADVEAACQRS